MALEKHFQKFINEGRITRDRVNSLETQIADVIKRSNEEFKDLSTEIRSELADVLQKGIIDYAKDLIHPYNDSGKRLGDAIPHLDSNLFELVRRYIAKNGQQTMFGVRLVLKDICEFYHQYAVDGTLTDTAFEDAEAIYHDELPHFPFQSLYAKEMSQGKPEIIEIEGVPMLKIYRGMEVPERDIFSEGDERKRRAGTIDLTLPGTDWSPIRAFAEGYQGVIGNKVLLSALVPLDDEEILRDSIDNSDLGDEWRGEHDAPLEKLTDCLIVAVLESNYHLLKNLKVEYTDASF